MTDLGAVPESGHVLRSGHGHPQTPAFSALLDYRQLFGMLRFAAAAVRICSSHFGCLIGCIPLAGALHIAPLQSDVLGSIGDATHNVIVGHTKCDVHVLRVPNNS